MDLGSRAPFTRNPKVSPSRTPIWAHAIRTLSFQILLKDPCICNASLTENGTWSRYTNMTGEGTDPSSLTRTWYIPRKRPLSECLRVGGTHNDGLQCSFKPDIFAFSLLLFLGSFLLAMWLQTFRDSQFFTRKIRTLISDFSLLLSLLIITTFNYLIGKWLGPLGLRQGPMLRLF